MGKGCCEPKPEEKCEEKKEEKCEEKKEEKSCCK